MLGRNETAPLLLADAALSDEMSALPDLVCVGDKIDTDMQEGFLRWTSRSKSVSIIERIPHRHLMNHQGKLSVCRGHGTQVLDGQLVATECGLVERVNKLISVRPLRQRYAPDT